MDEVAFSKYLKRGGRSEAAISRCIDYSKKFLQYIENYNLGSLNTLKVEELDEYVFTLEFIPKYSAKIDLWALIYLFDFLDFTILRDHAKELRQDRIKRTPFQLKKFRGVKKVDIKKLNKIGITNVKHLFRRCGSPQEREDLANDTGIPLNRIEELVKLSDLSRIGAIKSVRARLYYDAGFETPSHFVDQDPKEMREMLVQWVEDTGFDGIAPLPREIEYAIEKAKGLPKIIEY